MTTKEYRKYLKNEQRVEKGKEPLPLDPSHCEYVFRKGPHLGEVCGTAVRDGGRFCGACRKKKGKDSSHPSFCEYLWRKGPRKGTLCKAVVRDGGRFCGACRKKKSVIREMGESFPLDVSPDSEPEIPEVYPEPEARNSIEVSGVSILVDENGFLLLISSEYEKPRVLGHVRDRDLHSLDADETLLVQELGYCM